MKVQDFKTESINGRKRVSAQMIWENASRTNEEIYFEVNEKNSSAISCNVDAFFLSTVIPALYFGEKRYYIDGEVCPVLYEGFQEALACLSHWYYNGQSERVSFEVNTSRMPKKVPKDRNAACFLTGGIDSYASFFKNKEIYSPEHPRYFKNGIVAFGIEVRNPDKFKYVEKLVNKAAEKLGVSPIILYTNVSLIYEKDYAKTKHYFWRKEVQGAILAALAHILHNKVGNISIPSTHTYSNRVPWGTDPLLDPNYSSHTLTVHHDCFRYSRFDKIQIVAKNLDSALSLRVCNLSNRFRSDQLNCGQCEKCIVTMLGFLIVGKLKQLDEFPVNDVTKRMIIANVLRQTDDRLESYRELISPLEKIGRNDLAEAIEFVIKRWERQEFKNRVKQKISYEDRNLLKRSYRTLNRVLRR